jgi:hypothetical protein
MATEDVEFTAAAARNVIAHLTRPPAFNPRDSVARATCGSAVPEKELINTEIVVTSTVGVCCSGASVCVLSDLFVSAAIAEGATPPPSVFFSVLTAFNPAATADNIIDAELAVAAASTSALADTVVAPLAMAVEPGVSEA